jgi:hypothetical protein
MVLYFVKHRNNFTLPLTCTFAQLSYFRLISERSLASVHEICITKIYHDTSLPLKLDSYLADEDIFCFYATQTFTAMSKKAHH